MAPERANPIGGSYKMRSCWIQGAATAALAVLLCTAGVTGMAQKPEKWKVGTPIVTYWAGPAMTDAAATQMQEGGWNLVWCSTIQEMDVAHRHGLRAQLFDPLLNPASLDNKEKRAKLDALIEKVKNHPAMYCYFITDEPGAELFPGLGKLVAYLRKKDPAHLAYINLFPTYADNEQLGTEGDTVTAYQEHIDQYVSTVRPGLISWDHYQFAVVRDMPDYFLNLAMIRKKSLSSRIPFLNIVQACTWTKSMREPNEDEMRYLVYTTAAYGAQGISYYVYTPPTDHSPGIATPDGQPTRVYGWLKVLNPEFSAIVTQLQPLKSLGVYHAGMHPPGAVALPKHGAFRFDPPIARQEFIKDKPVKGALIGDFGAHGKATHAVVVNLDYKASATLTVRGPGSLEVFDASTGKWAPCGSNHATLQLQPGGGKLIRVAGTK